MMRNLYAVLLLILSISAASAEVTLEQIDRIRAPEGNFMFTVTTASEGNKTLTLEVRVKDNQRSLVRYIEPKGRALLFVEDNMWVYISGSRRALRISPRQKLLGGAASADIARLSYGEDYRIEASKAIGNATQVLSLVQKTKKASYGKIELTVMGDEGKPVKAVFYPSAGSRPIKTAHFENYQNVLGRMRPTRFRIVDHLDGDKQTVLTYSDFRFENTPENWFNPAYLKRLK
jgi:outer membrane lipoprotein-sorting protein